MRRIGASIGAVTMLLAAMAEPADATAFDFAFSSSSGSAYGTFDFDFPSPGGAATASNIAGYVSTFGSAYSPIVPGPPTFLTYSNNFAGYTGYTGTFDSPAGQIIFEQRSALSPYALIFSFGNADSPETFAFTAVPSVLGTPGPIAGAGLVPLLGLAGAYLFGRKRSEA